MWRSMRQRQAAGNAKRSSCMASWPDGPARFTLALTAEEASHATPHLPDGHTAFDDGSDLRGPQLRGGTLVYGRQTDCIYLDPVHTAQNADIWVSLNLYDTLTQPTDDGKSVVPGLASSWEVSQDGKAMTFRLRPNLKFADGSPLTVG